MSNITQAEFDSFIRDFRNAVNEEVMERSGSLAVEIAKGNAADIVELFYTYQERIKPGVEARGITAPELSEIFGVGIELNVNDGDE